MGLPEQYQQWLETYRQLDGQVAVAQSINTKFTSMASTGQQLLDPTADGGGWSAPVVLTTGEQTFLKNMASTLGLDLPGVPSSLTAEARQAYGPALASHLAALQAQQKYAGERLTMLDPLQAAGDIGMSLEDRKRILDIQKATGAGGVADRVKYQVQVGPGGRIIRSGDDGSFAVIGQNPELAGKKTSVMNDETTGHAWAYTMDDDGNVVGKTDLGQVAFPQIDPERKFNLEKLQIASNAQAQLAGIELQQRGQIIQAIGQDMSNQVMIGQLQHAEARLNLDRINAAFEQRRRARETVLKYGVTAASLRTDASGQQVTRLPFAEQMAAIMSSGTGRQFTADQFDLAVTGVNPDQEAQQTLDASSYASPIPGLVSAMQAARTTIQQVLGAPLGNKAALEAAAASAMPPGVK